MTFAQTRFRVFLELSELPLRFFPGKFWKHPGLSWSCYALRVFLELGSGFRVSGFLGISSEASGMISAFFGVHLGHCMVLADSSPERLSRALFGWFETDLNCFYWNIPHGLKYAIYTAALHCSWEHSLPVSWATEGFATPHIMTSLH